MRPCRTLIDLVTEIESGGSRGFSYRSKGAERDTPGASDRETYSLGRLRRSRGVTQTELARRLRRAQSAVSMMEGGEDHLMSTIRSVVEGLGGSIEVVAVFGEERMPLTVPGRPSRSREA